VETDGHLATARPADFIGVPVCDLDDSGTEGLSRIDLRLGRGNREK
jgi:hypothetical protein